MLICSCPQGASLEDIDQVTCLDHIGQIQKVIFQRIFNTGTTKNAMVVATSDPTLLASWSALKTATDGTKVVSSPIIGNPEFTPGDARTFGGGNATPGGVEKILGTNPTAFTSVIYDLPAKQISQLKKLMCETDLGVFLVNEKGDIYGLVDDLDSPANFLPIPVQAMFVGDKGPGGFDNADSNALNFQLPEGWADMISKFTPSDFDAKTQL